MKNAFCFTVFKETIKGKGPTKMYSIIHSSTVVLMAIVSIVAGESEPIKMPGGLDWENLMGSPPYPSSEAGRALVELRKIQIKTENSNDYESYLLIKKANAMEALARLDNCTGNNQCNDSSTECIQMEEANKCLPKGNYGKYYEFVIILFSNP